MEYTFLFYCFLSVILISGGSFFLYSSGLQVAAPIFFLGSLGAVLYFGLRWFTTGGDIKNTGANANSAWPPVINYCPDFMSLTNVSGKKMCIDTVGVAAQLAGATSPLNQWTDPSQTQASYTFDPNQAVQALCKQAQTNGLTWEGVWNGTACSGTAPPPPP